MEVGQGSACAICVVSAALHEALQRRRMTFVDGAEDRRILPVVNCVHVDF